MKNKEIRDKIQLVEDDNKRLGEEYNEIRKKFEYMKSVLDIREMEIKNNYEQIKQLKNALQGESVK